MMKTIIKIILTLLSYEFIKYIIYKAVIIVQGNDDIYMKYYVEGQIMWIITTIILTLCTLILIIENRYLKNELESHRYALLMLVQESDSLDETR